jgi:hypothetical protein
MLGIDILGLSVREITRTKGIEYMQVCGKQMVVEGKLIRIARMDAENFSFLEDPIAAVRQLQRGESRVDIFTFVQMLSDRERRYSYLMEWDNLAAVPISTYDEWLSKQINFKVRNKVRKAAKSGVTVREMAYDDFLIDGICEIYNESEVRQGKRFWHFGKDLDAVRKTNGTYLDQTIFLGALFEEKLIGFVKLVMNEDKSQAGLMQIVSMVKHRDKAPTNALIAQAVQSCADRRIRYLWYANFSYGRKQTDSLAEFKRHNGFEKIEIPRYYVPMTIAGRAALRLGLHHKVIDWVPGPVTTAYRKARSVWYGRRSAVVTDVRSRRAQRLSE